MEILSTITQLQNNFVDTLFDCFVDKEKKELFGRAPTAAGKTIMQDKLIDRIFDYYNSKQKKVVFIISSLSKGRLIEQNYEKTVKYKHFGFIKNINPYLINTKKNNDTLPIYCYNTFFLGRDLLKRNTKLNTKKTLLKTLDQLKSEGVDIILVRDECHQATNNLDKFNEYFARIINFSASEWKGHEPDAEIKEEDAVNAYLIKRVEYMSSNIYLPVPDFEINSPQYFEYIDALRLYIKIKPLFIKYGVNPALITQISNSSDGKKEMKVLQHIFNLDEFRNEIRWLYITHDKDPKTNNHNNTLNFTTNKEWEDYVKGDNAEIDVIIFKMKITEGWDIPRANMLFQIRDSKSTQLDGQVMGRGRRNSFLLNFDEIDPDDIEILMTEYVWGIKETSKNSDKYTVTLASEKVKDELQIQTTRLKRNFTTQNSTFNLKGFLDQQPDLKEHKSYTVLLPKFFNTSKNFQDECFAYIGNDEHSTSKFIKILDYLPLIHDKFEKLMEDFESNFERNTTTVTLQDTTEYSGNKNYGIGIYNSFWDTNSQYSVFYNESMAEMGFVYKMMVNDPNKKFNIKTIEDNGKTIKLFGKNYILNSDIYYEYYSKGSVHKTYPDYIIKNENDTIFVAEIKSLNGNDKSFENEYKEKIDVLKRVYKAASSICDHYFVIGIQKNDDYEFTVYHNGNTSVMNEDGYRNLFNQA